MQTSEDDHTTRSHMAAPIATLERLLAMEQYSLRDEDKQAALVPGLQQLTDDHRARSIEYRRIIDAAYPGFGKARLLADLPWLPVGLFKWLDLKSIPDDQVFKVMASSGTTGQVPSRIYLDVETARLQTRALGSIVTHYVGQSRLPMLILDHPGVVADRRHLTARGAGILGMLSYGRDHLYALDEHMAVDVDALEAWLRAHAHENLLIFGFTFLVWRHFYEPLADRGIDLSRAILIHSGGWKRLADLQVTNAVFRERLTSAFGITRIHNFYGMVEQVGSVFFECDAGYFHPPNFADVLVRDAGAWGPAALGIEGVVEVLSLLPRSYPGHVLLTEDTGVVHGVDDCPCGRGGRRFSVGGRVPRAEIRGCSDTFTAPG